MSRPNEPLEPSGTIGRLLRGLHGPVPGIAALPQTAQEYGDSLPALSTAHEYTHTIKAPCPRCGGTGVIGNGYHELDAHGNTYARCPECG